MQFQQPPPAPGPTQQQQPQAQVQQQNLGARGFVPPQNVHQMVFMTVRTGFFKEFYWVYETTEFIFSCIFYMSVFSKLFF